MTMYAFPTHRAKFSPDELDGMTTHVYGLLSELIGRISREHWAEGLAWYVKAGNLSAELGRRYGYRRETVAAVIAALSPRIRWAHNVEDAHEVLGHDDQWSTYALGANVTKAAYIMDGMPEDVVLGGRKVRSFWQNIANPHSSLDVTLDAWMIKALGLPTERYLQRKGVYDALSNAFRRLASEHGILPHQLQAAVWIHIRGNAE